VFGSLGWMTSPAPVTMRACAPSGIATPVSGGCTEGVCPAARASWSSSASSFAVLRTSSRKSLSSLLLVSRPTTAAKPMRMISVSVAETAAMRQRTGQLCGLAIARSMTRGALIRGIGYGARST
jgi:hypothetical protein